MRKATAIGIILLLSAIAFVVVRNHSTLAESRTENERLRQRVADLVRAGEENEALLRQQKEENQRLRVGQSELARLRGDATQLRRQMNELQSARNIAALARTNAASASETNQPPPIDKYTANVRARLAWNQTLVAGGWRTAEGKRILVLVEPQLIKNNENEATLPRQLSLRAKYLELPDEALTQLGLAKLASDEKENSSQMVLTPEEMALVFETLKQSRGTDLLSAPEVTTLDRRQAQIKVVDVMKTPSGEEYEVGPSVDVVPTISPDGDSVDLTVLARLNLRWK